MNWTNQIIDLIKPIVLGIQPMVVVIWNAVLFTSLVLFVYSFVVLLSSMRKGKRE